MILKPQEKGTKQRLIVVDESSMIDSLSMKKLIDIAIDNNDKIVFIGDVKQVPSRRCW